MIKGTIDHPFRVYSDRMISTKQRESEGTEDRFARFSIVFRLLEVEEARQRIHVDAFILEFSDVNRSRRKEIQSLGREERSEETRRRRRSRVGGGMGRGEDGDDKLS